MSPSEPSDTVELVVTSDALRASTVRVVVASVAADVGCSLDEIDDLRLGVDEVFTGFTELDLVERIRLSVRASGDVIEIALEAVDRDDVPELDELATTILRSVVDEVRVEGARIVLAKRAAELASAGRDVAGG